jgi:hypothetical protein
LVPYADWQAANEAPVFVLLLGWEGQDFKRLARLLTTKLEHALLPYGISGLIIHPNMPSNRTAARLGEQQRRNGRAACGKVAGVG